MEESNGTSQSNSSRTKRARPVLKRATPPPQDKLVLIFISASTIFALLTFSPFLLGHFPEHDHVSVFGNYNTSLSYRLSQQSRLGVEGVGLGNIDLPLARGSSGLPMSVTPALIGAKHGSITCKSDSGDFKLDELAYWNEPGPYDTGFQSPFAPQQDAQSSRRYVTFEPDRGGWNNIRMSMEIIFVFAAATGRTLVLPPDTPFYLLTDNQGKGSKHHGFADFIDVNKLKEVDIITMKEFLDQEGGEGGLLSLPRGNHGQKIMKAAEYCYYFNKSDRPCDLIYEFLKDAAYVPELQAGRECLIFDLPTKVHEMSSSSADTAILDAMPAEKQRQIHQFCNKRDPVFFGGELDTASHVHFHSGNKYHRLLNHFYTFLYFTDAKIGNHYKRFVRDNLHYTDVIYCAAGKIIKLLEEEALTNVVSPVSRNPGYSAMHIRRGDFQYKKTKISAEEWLNATIDVLYPGEVVYVATDEKDRSFFEPLAQRYRLKFLDQFSEVAGLDELDPNFAGKSINLVDLLAFLVYR